MLTLDKVFIPYFNRWPRGFRIWIFQGQKPNIVRVLYSVQALFELRLLNKNCFTMLRTIDLTV